MEESILIVLVEQADGGAFQAKKASGMFGYLLKRGIDIHAGAYVTDCVCQEQGIGCALFSLKRGRRSFGLFVVLARANARVAGKFVKRAGVFLAVCSSAGSGQQ